MRSRPLSPPDLKKLPRDVRRIVETVAASDDALQRLQRSLDAFERDGVADILLASTPANAAPDPVFDRLRWGGQLVYVSRQRGELAQLAQAYAQRPEFDLELGPVAGARRWVRRGASWFVARKVLLDRPEQLTTRHSFDVRLSRVEGGGYVVLKRVPELEETARRLLRMAPERGETSARQMARKLVDHVFPIFLTREAAFLKIVHRDLPAAMRDRVPRVLSLHRDDRGLVRAMRLNWMRQGGEPIGPVEFGRQAAALLQAVHESARVVHLDLRLDNFVVTPTGVGLVDFGSAVRIDEDIARSKMLETLFHEMLSASQIRRDLKKLQGLGRVTSPVFDQCYERLEPAVDLFYLALQMTRPHRHDEFRGLVRGFDSDEQESLMLRLRRDVLRPEGGTLFHTAGDLLYALQRLSQDKTPVAPRQVRPAEAALP